MLLKTRGIIFRTVKYSETSIIADIYTEQRGLQAYIISGVRSQQSRVSAGLLQVMSLVDLVAYSRADKGIQRIKEIKAGYIYEQVPFEVMRASVGLFMIELAQKTIKESEANEALFEFVWNSFVLLDQTPQTFANHHLWFMTGLTTYLGFMPHGAYSEQTPFFDLKEGVFCKDKPIHGYYLAEGIATLLYQLMLTTPQDIHTINMSRSDRQILLQQMLLFYKYHIENMIDLNTHTILKEIF